MTDRRLVTPYVLDQPSPGLRGLATGQDWLNPAKPADGTMLQKLAALHEPLAAKVHTVVAEGNRPISIAGDCCAVLPVIAGLQRAGVAPRLLWFDAHGDFNTPETSPSGFIGGMPLAMLVGRGDLTLLNALGAHPLDEADVLLCDARDLDPEEGRALAASTVRHLRSLDAVVSEALVDRPLHVHLDVDFLSLEDVRAVRYPVPGGPRVAELLKLGPRLAASRAAVSISMTVWSFDLDTDGRSAKACLLALGGFR